MIGAISKPLVDLTEQDLETLCEKKWPESQYVEVEAISFATGAGVPFELCGFRGPDAVVGKIDGPFIRRYELAMDKDEILGNILTDLLDAAGEPIEKPATISLVNWP